MPLSLRINGEDIPVSYIKRQVRLYRASARLRTLTLHRAICDIVEEIAADVEEDRERAGAEKGAHERALSAPGRFL